MKDRMAEARDWAEMATKLESYVDYAPDWALLDDGSIDSTCVYADVIGAFQRAAQEAYRMSGWALSHAKEGE